MKQQSIVVIPDDFRVRPGESVDLALRPTRIDPIHNSKREYKKLLRGHTESLSAQQELLYATNKHAILVIFQAMDAAGKDGCIKHVMSGVNPQGCDVFSYSHPTPVELRHDFLWRTTRDLPERGKIAIFNRSYYEEVLIVRVHPEILHGEDLPDDGDDEAIWRERYNSIVGLERHLHRNGTRIVKFFLHLSKDEQCKRLLERIDKREKNWKIKLSDIEERKFWDQYQAAYECCLSATSSEESPWYIVPADNKRTARLIVSKIILNTLEQLHMSPPMLTPDRERQLQSMRSMLLQD